MLEEFLKKAKAIHGELYDYSLFEYINNHTKGKIICQKHGVFEQMSYNHLLGKGCNKCGRIKTINAHKYTTEEFIKRAKLIHGDTYNYDLVDYIRSQIKIKIICGLHGIFEQLPQGHLRGMGCNECRHITVGNLLRSNKEDFVNKAKLVHNDLYDYSLFEYIHIHAKGKIICHKHGIFEQEPNSHLDGNGCSKCTHRVSKSETKWLDSLQIPLRQYSIKTAVKKINVDGYDPDTHTAYQFHGDYWHGNPETYNPSDIHPLSKKTYGYLYKETLENDKLIRESGYNLVVLWEREFKRTL